MEEETQQPQEHGITFYPQPDLWAIKINKDGIFFNREMYPNSTPEDFVKCFIEILEMNYDVHFEKRAPLTEQTSQ